MTDITDAQFRVGDTVASKSGKEYRVTDVFVDSWVNAKGQRYGVQRIRDGKVFGPFRNFYATSGFRLLSRKEG
jgi:hypothetical protein